MKRLIAAVLCMTMVAAITGCGNSENESDGVSKTETGDKPEVLVSFVQQMKRDFMNM